MKSPALAHWKAGTGAASGVSDIPRPQEAGLGRSFRGCSRWYHPECGKRQPHARPWVLASKMGTVGAERNGESVTPWQPGSWVGGGQGCGSHILSAPRPDSPADKPTAPNQGDGRKGDCVDTRDCLPSSFSSRSLPPWVRLWRESPACPRSKLSLSHDPVRFPAPHPLPCC